jgi:predicted metal-dependent peptidase
MLDLEDTFATLHAVACERLGDDFYCNIALGDAEEFPAARNMAYTTRDKRGDILVVVAPKLVVCGDVCRIEGVLRHEFGHAALWHLDRPKHSERDADAVAAWRQACPEWRIQAIDCSALLLQHGSLHCATMQIPAAVFQ